MMRFVVVLMCFVFPLWAHAGVLITEIMYAPEGTDTKHEWVEVCADTATDIDGWKLFENDTNHGLTLVAGVSALGANECAVIADDAATFSVDYPSFSGNLFDSAFSLLNTGESIAIRNADAMDVDAVSYTDALGAKDDGNSLHRQGATFTASVPTPGTEGSGGNTNTDTTTTTTSTSGGGGASRQTVFTYEYLSVEPPQDVYLRVEGVFDVLQHSNARFVAEVYNARGIAESASSITWNFGDGTTAEGKEVVHRFAHEGAYVLSVSARVGTLQDSVVHTVNVHAPNLELSVLPEQKGVRLVNKSSIPADVSGWRIVSGGSYFVIPDNTIIASQGSTIFDASVIKLHQLALAQQVLLYMPNGTVFVNKTAEEAAPKVEVQAEIVEQEITIDDSIVEIPIQKTIPAVQSVGLIGTRVLPRVAAAPPKNVSIVAQPTANSKPPSAEGFGGAQQHTAPKIETEPTINPNAQVASAAASNVLPDGALWWATMSALAVVGAAGVFVARNSVTDADGFEIEEG